MLLDGSNHCTPPSNWSDLIFELKYPAMENKLLPVQQKSSDLALESLELIEVEPIGWIFHMDWEPGSTGDKSE